MLVKQVTERGYPVAEVASRLGVSAHSLYQWLKRYDPSANRPNLQTSKPKSDASRQSSNGSPRSATS
jgi:transposase